MKRESKQVWCVVVDPKGAIKAQVVNLYEHVDRYSWRRTVRWKPAGSFKSEIWSQHESEEAAKSAMVDHIRGRLIRFEAAVHQAVSNVNKAEAGLVAARNEYATEVARAKAAGVEL